MDEAAGPRPIVIDMAWRGSLATEKRMFFVCILKSEKTGRHYIGSCGDIELRLKDHDGNRVRSTKNKGPYKLIYKEEFAVKTEALKREKRIKKYKSGRAFKELLASPSSSLA